MDLHCHLSPRVAKQLFFHQGKHVWLSHHFRRTEQKLGPSIKDALPEICAWYKRSSLVDWLETYTQNDLLWSCGYIKTIYVNNGDGTTIHKRSGLDNGIVKLNTRPQLRFNSSRSLSNQWLLLLPVPVVRIVVDGAKRCEGALLSLTPPYHFFQLFDFAPHHLNAEKAAVTCSSVTL